MNYTYQYRDEVSVDELSRVSWDLFISAYNTTDRVNTVFDAVNAHQKNWIIHREYGFDAAAVPVGAFISDQQREDDYIIEFMEAKAQGRDLPSQRICIDVTGFMRPHMLYLVRYLAAQGVKSLDVLYAEPGHYSGLDGTKFASERVHTVRQIAGYEGRVLNETANDVLVVAAGFEDKLTAEVAEDKDRARKIVLLGLPSLKADMYQQGVLRTTRARDALGEGARQYFTPASDPFATATVLSELVARERERGRLDNLYLSPLATKPSALGFALYYIHECQDEAVSIIYPFSENYAPDASTGTGRIWKYCLEF